jgi:hypothetical protein
MEHCPLCRNPQAARHEPHTGVGTGAVPALFGLFHVSCPACGEYDISETAHFLLQRFEEVRQRAMADLQQRGHIGQSAGEGEILRVTVESLQGYWREEAPRGA